MTEMERKLLTALALLDPAGRNAYPHTVTPAVA